MFVCFQRVPSGGRPGTGGQSRGQCVSAGAPVRAGAQHAARVSAPPRQRAMYSIQGLGGSWSGATGGCRHAAASARRNAGMRGRQRAPARAPASHRAAAAAAACCSRPPAAWADAGAAAATAGARAWSSAGAAAARPPAMAGGGAPGSPQAWGAPALRKDGRRGAGRGVAAPLRAAASCAPRRPHSGRGPPAAGRGAGSQRRPGPRAAQLGRLSCVIGRASSSCVHHQGHSLRSSAYSLRAVCVRGALGRQPGRRPAGGVP
jgi:hypothetical protein